MWGTGVESHGLAGSLSHTEEKAGVETCPARHNLKEARYAEVIENASECKARLLCCDLPGSSCLRKYTSR